MHRNLQNGAEFGSKKLLIWKYRMGGPNNSDILENWFPPEVRSPLFNFWKFENPERGTPE